MSQIEQVRKHLRAGNTLTQGDAIYRFGAYRLAPIIKRLRQDGERIGTRLIKKGATRYAEYYSAHALVSGAKVRAIGFSRNDNYFPGDEGRVVEVSTTNPDLVRVYRPGGREFWALAKNWVRIEG